MALRLGDNQAETRQPEFAPVWQAGESARYEIKVPLDDEARACETAIRLNSACFSEAFRAREVHSIYFDTPSFRHFFDHVNGLGHRSKLRLRWYGTNTQAATLEIKSRHGNVGRKKQMRLALPTEIIKKSLDDEAYALLKSAYPPIAYLIPTVAVSYSRAYYQSACRRVRLTYDTKLRFSPTPRSAALAGARQVSTAVLELKYRPLHDDFARGVMRQFGRPITRYSKYVEAIQQCYDLGGL